ncbi:unnamed protein product [Closterium sp. NIES-54]
MEEALAGPDREKWLVSRDAEYQSLLENGTWDLVVLPEGKKAVQCKWVLRIKTDDKGQVTIYKSRLVAKGLMQKEKQDFNEIFAPTAKPPTLRVLLADAAVSGKSIIQMDISTAFLNGILEEDVYMTQPPGYEDGTGRVCKLKKSIYGLKQAPRCWYQKLAAVLEEMGFRTSSCDESLFLKGEGEKLVLFLVYVDDILLFSSSMKEIQKVQQQLMKNFKCKTLGEVKYDLGMHVERDLDHRWLKLHQENFIKELGEKCGIENERKVATPLPAEFKLVKAAEDEGVEAEEQQKFQSLVGSLLYAAVHTRPDISFSVGQLARVVQNPSEEQVDAAKRVVKYLNFHPSIGVEYSASAQVKQKGVEVLKEKGELLGEGKLFLTCFTDATWASEKDDSSSVGGYICVVGGGPPRVSLPETSPTLLWTGKVGDASAFRVWGSRAFVRDLSADKLSPRAVPCVFLGFPPDAPGWQFYHPTSRRVLSSQDVTFDESVPYYRLFPYRTASLPPPPLFLAPGAATGAKPAGAGSGGAGSGGAETEGAEPGGAGTWGAEPGGAESGGGETWGTEPGGAATGGTEPGGAEPGGADPGGAGFARVASRGASSRREVLSP